MKTTNQHEHQWGYVAPKLVQNNQLLWRRLCVVPGCNLLEKRWTENTIFPTEEPVMSSSFSVTGHPKDYGGESVQVKNPWLEEVGSKQLERKLELE